RRRPDCCCTRARCSTDQTSDVWLSSGCGGRSVRPTLAAACAAQWICNLVSFMSASVRVRFRAPQLFQPVVAAAVEAVELVPNGILLVVVLVVLLGAVERLCGEDVGGDPAEALELRRLRVLGGLLLRRVVVEDRGAVLLALVAELSSRVERIDVVP